jgi:hypothetical protein
MSVWESLSERFDALQIQPAFSLQLHQFLARCNVAKENPITLDEPCVVESAVDFDRKPLSFEFIQYGNKAGAGGTHRSIVAGNADSRCAQLNN